MEINLEEMQVYNFSNLNLQEESNNNCFSCDGDYISGDCDCDCDYCDYQP